MNFKRLITATAIVSAALLALTGCTPPMPPEVRAALAEKTYTCVSGTASVALPHALGDLGSGWQDSMVSACPDMSFTIAEAGKPADLVIDATGVAASGAYATVPFALDATVVAVNISGLTSINLTAANIQDIVTGKVTDWADKSIAKSNPGLGLTSEPIVLDARIQQNGLKPLTDWLARLNGGSFDASKFKAVPELTLDDAMTLPEGGIAFLPYSVNAEAMWTTAGIVTDKSQPNDTAVVPDSDHINSGGSQLRVQKTESAITVNLKADAKPLAPAGQDKAVDPYQAVYAVPLSLSGSDNLVARAIARFLLRQDSQGMLGSSYLLPIPETVRVEVLDLVSKGLTLPKATAAPTN